jgi:PPOX class probable F420-dependent enzyme
LRSIPQSTWEIDFIERQRVARLATVDARGRPGIVPIVFAMDGTQLYTPIDAKPKRVSPDRLRRVRDIRANPNVAVLFDEYDEDWRRLAWVQLRGVARLVEPGTEQQAGSSLIEAKYPQYKTLSLADRPMIVIEIKRLISWRAGDQKRSSED